MRGNRRQQILEVLARELETKPGTRITTAALAAAVGVSEAALYRHFPSKARMFEGLIEFAEDTIFGVFNQVMASERDTATRCFQLTVAVLRFAERNPGIARILVGDVLVGEHARLRARVAQFHARIETQFRQALREAPLAGDTAPVAAEVTAAAGLLLAVVAGRLDQYVRSEFALAPTQGWEPQWRLLSTGLFAGA